MAPLHDKTRQGGGGPCFLPWVRLSCEYQQRGLNVAWGAMLCKTRPKEGADMSLKYIKFPTSQFIAETSGMTSTQKGVYITLLCIVSEQERPLTQSCGSLARRCGCSVPAFKKALEALKREGILHIADGEIWISGCKNHINLIQKQKDSAAPSAKRGQL